MLPSLPHHHCLVIYTILGQAVKPTLNIMYCKEVMSQSCLMEDWVGA